MKKKIVPPNAMLYSFAKKKLDLKKKSEKIERKKFLLLENTERFFDINTYIRLYPAIFYCKPKSITRQLIFGLTKKKIESCCKTQKKSNLYILFCASKKYTTTYINSNVKLIYETIQKIKRNL